METVSDRNSFSIQKPYLFQQKKHMYKNHPNNKNQTLVAGTPLEKIFKSKSWRIFLIFVLIWFDQKKIGIRTFEFTKRSNLNIRLTAD